jgi:8-oxo-dGTP diphosphatase
MKKFNIRVYGLLINSNNEVLVSDEKRNGFEFTKFPGGGLEFGEGTIDCLKREFLEELNLEISVKEMFYFTDFFQVSAFNKNDQLISIYYLVEANTIEKISVQSQKLHIENQENHRWISLKALKSEDFTFPIDQLVAEKIINSFQSL